MRRPLLATGGIAYHILNRRAGRLPLFEKPGDYSAFEKVLGEAYERTNVRIAAYCLMANHWHLLLWPREDGELSEVMRWITVTHTQSWHAHRHSSGSGLPTPFFPPESRCKFGRFLRRRHRRFRDELR
jgi:putative transposase